MQGGLCRGPSLADRQAGPTQGPHSPGLRLWFNLSLWQAGLNAVYQTRGFFFFFTTEFICFGLEEIDE